MPRTWEKMTQEEKIEDLRNDVKSIFRHLNDLTQTQHAIAKRLGEIASLANEVAKKVEHLSP
jgi:DNA-binding ferritin-like protein